MQKIRERYNGKYSVSVDRLTFHYTFNGQKFFFVVGEAENDEPNDNTVWENMGEPLVEYVNIRFNFDDGSSYTHRFYNNKKYEKCGGKTSLEVFEDAVCRQYMDIDKSIHEIETDIQFAKWLLEHDISIYMDTYKSEKGTYYNVSGRPNRKDSLKGDLDI